MSLSNRNILFVLIIILSLTFLFFFLPGIIPIRIYAIINIFTSVFYLLICWFIFKSELTLKDILIFTALAVIIRLIFIGFFPVGSDDVYRYMWDGKIQANGINPYLFAPDDPKLSFLHTDILPSKVNFSHMKTIYFPLSQWLFFAGYLLSGESVWGYKLLLFITELVTIFSLYKLLKYSNINTKYLLLYVFCPLPIIQFAVDAHLDALGFPFLLLSILFYLKERKVTAAILLGLSLSIKPVGLVFIPILFLKEKGIANKLKITLLPLIIFFVQFIPYIFKANPFEAFIIYTENWTFNGFIFDILNNFIQDNQKARLICGILLIVFLIPLYFSKKKYTDKIYYSAFLMMIFSPVVHPWYIGWIAILLPLTQKWSGIFYTALGSLTVFTVLNYQLSGIWKEYWIVLFVEYLPVLVILYYELFRQKNLKTS